MDTTPPTAYESARPDLAADVVVIGVGIAGLTSALLLAQSGKRVVLLEAGRVVTNITGFTTAKLTSNHGLIYKRLIDDFGKEKARIYAEANTAGIQHVVNYAQQHGIDCDLQRMPSYTYGVSEDEKQKLIDEAAAAQSCGLPAAYVEEVPLPFETVGAVKFEEQYIFHPRKYLLAIADQFAHAGGQIYENTRTIKIEEQDDECLVTTEHGVVRAKDVIIATNFPIYDPKLFFARLLPRRSYVLAVKLEGGFPAGMFYSTEEPEHSLRPHWSGTEQEIVLIGGETHQVGKGGDTVQRYRQLEEWARQNFSVRSVEYHWSTQDTETYDGVPMIGKLTSSTRHLCGDRL